MNVATTTHCVRCEHRRCSRCPTERYGLLAKQSRSLRHSLSHGENPVRRPAGSGQRVPVLEPRVEKKNISPTENDSEASASHPSGQQDDSPVLIGAGITEIHGDRTIITEESQSTDYMSHSKKAFGVDLIHVTGIPVDDSTLLETERVFSTISGTTLVDETAIASITERLNIFHGLDNLWPQLIICCGSVDTAKGTIARLLE